MIKKLLLGAAFACVLIEFNAFRSYADAPLAHTPQDANLQLSVNFPALDLAKIEVGDFHFVPGQRAPVHTHEAPALGYVSKGRIMYKVEGRDPVLLQEGDVYYEPAGPRITMFDNASTKEEAIFIDINLQQEGEPFIVFENPPTEAIDRRSLPEGKYNGVRVDGADIYTFAVQPSAKQFIDISNPVSGYVAQGNVELRVNGKRVKRLKSGDMFYQYQQDAGLVLVNTSADKPAKVVAFRLHKAP